MKTASGKTINIGGQALIEGIMFKSENKISLAVRKNNKIIVESEEVISLTKKYPFLNIFLVRGIISLYEMLKIGIKTLNRSAEISDEEVNEKDKLITTFFSIFVAIIIFLGIPFLISKVLAKSFLSFNLIEGLARIVIFILYLYLISLIPDVRRVFQYHGAEHKVINCYENIKSAKEVTPKKAKQYSTIHPRCGTSFLFFVLIISIFVFSLFNTKDLLMKFLLRIILLPLIVGLSYEVLKLSSKFNRNFLFKLITYPGLLIQKITTKEPDLKQLEVAVAAFNEHFK